MSNPVPFGSPTPTGCHKHPVGPDSFYLMGRVSQIIPAMRGTSIEDFVGFVPIMTGFPLSVLICRVRPSFSKTMSSPVGWYVVSLYASLMSPIGRKVRHFASLRAALKDAELEPSSVDDAVFAMFEVMNS